MNIIFTKTSRYTYHQDYVSLYRDIKEAEPPQIPSQSKYNFKPNPSTQKPNTQDARYNFQKPSTVEMENEKTTFNKPYKTPYSSSYKKNDLFCHTCSESNDGYCNKEDDDVVFLQTNKPLMHNQFQIIGQPKEVKIDSTNMLRYAKDWNIS